MVMQKLRRLIAVGPATVLLVVIASIALAACGGGSDSSSSTSSGGTSTGGGEPSQNQEEVNLLFTGPYGNGYTTAEIEGVEAYADENNVNVTARDSTLEPTKQYAQVQDAVASQQFQAMVIIPLDGVGLVPAVEQAIDKDIAITSTDFALGPDNELTKPTIQVKGQAGSVYEPYVVRGEEMAKAWIQACEGIDPCQGAFLTGIAALPWEKVVVETLKEEIKGHSNIEFVAYQETGSYATADATSVARNVLQANPDLTVLSAVTDPIAHGWELAANDAGVGDQVKILGIGASTYGVEAVRDGRWFSTILALPFEEGRLGAELAVKAARGEGTPGGVAVSAAEESGVPLLLTQETLPADFEGQWEA